MKPEPLTEDELVHALKAEGESACNYYETVVADEQEKAIEYYDGKPFGDEVEGLSQIVLPDVAEAVDYMTISVLRLFVSGDRVVEFQAKRADDEGALEEATEAVQQIFMQHQDGYRVLHDWLKSGLIEKITETLLKTVIASAWNSGGEPSMAIMSLTQKQIAAAFAGLAQSRRETGDKKLKIIAGADVYVSDTGEVQLVPDRFCSTRDALIVDPAMWEIAVLDPMKKKALAATGLADRDALFTEVALKCLNEAGSGVVADLS